MPGIVIGVESDQITMQNPQQQLIANRQDTVDLATRERGMQKEPDLYVRLRVTNFLAQHLGKKHEMIIMDPDQIAVSNFTGNRLCE